MARFRRRRVVQQHVKGAARIGVDGDRGRDVLVDLRRINLDVDDIGAGGIFLQLAINISCVHLDLSQLFKAVLYKLFMLFFGKFL